MITSPAPTPRRRLPRAVSVFAERRTWSALLYAVVGLFQGVFGFVFTIVTLTVSTGLLVTFVGLPLMAATGLVSRWLGDGVRRGANLFIGADTPAPAPFRSRPGLLGWIGSSLSDGTAWRARLYLLLKFPAGVFTFVVTVVFWAYGLFAVSYPAWRPFSGCNASEGGSCHRGFALGHHVVDRPAGVVVTAVLGVLILLAAPWVTRAVVSIDRLLVRALLGPTDRSVRVEELERTRATVLDDSAATLRRIERDLHDGAQARLVALAMNVGLAREKLAEGGDPAEATRLLESAHVTAKEAITELRDLARGIHPPVLDSGLDAALATLAAHSAIPVRLAVDVAERPDPAIETMAYFCVAELLTNAGKHSGAGHVDIDARTTGGRLVVTVVDDGRGGARVGAGTGLSGLAERVATVDGRLAIVSPEGGPTTATVEVPLRARATS